MAQRLILGAGGFLGLNLVDALLLRGGEPPRCGRRRRSNVLALRQRRVPLVEADLDEPSGLFAAMEGCETVFHLAGYYPRLSLDKEAALALGLRQLRTVLDAAAKAGVRRLIYVSSTATVAPAPSGPSDESNRYAAPPGYGTYHDLKWAMEQLAEQEDRLEAVIACPSGCIGPWDIRVGTSAVLVGLARGLDPPHPDGVVNLVDARDVASALVALAEHPSPPRRILLAAENHRLHSLLVELAPRYGVPPPSAPLSAEEAMRLADAEEARASAGGGRALLSREIVDLVVHGVPLSGALAERTLGIQWRPLAATLSSFEEWARRMKIIPPAALAGEVAT